MRIIGKIIAWYAAFWAAVAAVAAVIKFTSDVEDDPADSHFSLVSVFGGTDFRPTTQILQSSSALTMFGGTKIDLRRSMMGAAQITLRLVTVTGGTDVVVPDTWRVTVVGDPKMGGHDVHVSAHELLPDDAPRLVIDARTVFGGLRVQARPVLQSAKTG
ncbi:MAG TPA: hypothetical protein VLB67_09375 [Acidimicrobiia bacterium]|nr:hypothetical protein [Acidimicrobiia bacterium]